MKHSEQAFEDCKAYLFFLRERVPKQFKVFLDALQTYREARVAEPVVKALVDVACHMTTPQDCCKALQEGVKFFPAEAQSFLCLVAGILAEAQLWAQGASATWRLFNLTCALAAVEQANCERNGCSCSTGCMTQEAYTAEAYA